MLEHYEEIDYNIITRLWTCTLLSSWILSRPKRGMNENYIATCSWTIPLASLNLISLNLIH
jgi:hypothetical protein